MDLGLDSSKQDGVRRWQRLVRNGPGDIFLITISLPSAGLWIWDLTFQNKTAYQVSALAQRSLLQKMSAWPDQRFQVVELLHNLVEGLDLSSASFCLAISTLDRILLVNSCEPHQLNTLACACLLLASKYWDDNSPTVADVCKYQKDICVSDLSATEINVLMAIGYQFEPTALDYLTLLAPDWQVAACAEHLLQLLLYRHEILGFLPQELAIATVELASDRLKRQRSVDEEDQIEDFKFDACQQLLKGSADYVILGRARLKRQALAKRDRSPRRPRALGTVES